MKSILVFLLLCIILVNGRVFTLGLKEDANMSGSCIEKERQALLILKSHLDLFGSLDDWGSEEDKTDCCQWVGVHCNNDTGHVIRLDLHGRGLNGSVSLSLGDLTSLTHLDLSSNNITGNLPNTVFQLSNLFYLNVSDNSLNGSIPELTGCSSVSTLDLSSNNFTGDLPSSVAQLLYLDYLDVSHNSFSGSIPDFTRSPSLSILDLSSNCFTGDLPYNVGQLTHLYYLDISHNFVNGNIPDFTGCPSMSTLDLSHNNLSGHFPISVGHLLNISYLDVSSNNITGDLPSSVGQLLYLDYLDVSSNSLNGVISDPHFQNLTRLTYLDLSFNSFSLDRLRSIPSQLETIRLQSCTLGRIFPPWLKTQKTYRYLDISSAGISDNIPSWFWDQLPFGLRFLNISSNEMKGVLPDLTAEFDDYPGMDLSDNHFEGRVRLYSKLAALNLSGNKLSGNLSFLCQIDELITLIDLSNNSFTGSLPDCWSNFQKKLTILNLSHNNLSGKIPSSLESLSHLEALYLRNNSFVGELPTSLSNCTKLRFVDIGENNICGTLPAWIGERLTELYVLILRSNQFSGIVPRQICGLYNLQILDLSKNKFSGNIPKCIGNLRAMAKTQQFPYEIANHHYTSYAVTVFRNKRSRPSHVRSRSAFNRTDKYCFVYNSSYPCWGTSTHTTRRKLASDFYTISPKSLLSGNDFVIEAIGEGLFTDTALVAWKGKIHEFGRINLELLKSIDLSNNNFSGILPNNITSLVDLKSLNLSYNKFHGQVPKDIGQLTSLEFLDLSRNEFSGSIPWRLSFVNSLGDLDLSNNNFSGEIPVGNGGKLQQFNSSSYSGNPLLYGPPLTQEGEVKPDHLPIDGKVDDEESQVWKSYYMGMGVGFGVGFWGICSAIFLIRGCRHFLFASLSHVKDWIYVTAAVYLRKFKRGSHWLRQAWEISHTAQ